MEQAPAARPTYGALNFLVRYGDWDDAFATAAGIPVDTEMHAQY